MILDGILTFVVIVSTWMESGTAKSMCHGLRSIECIGKTETPA